MPLLQNPIPLQPLPLQHNPPLHALPVAASSVGLQTALQEGSVVWKKPTSSPLSVEPGKLLTVSKFALDSMVEVAPFLTAPISTAAPTVELSTHFKNAISSGLLCITTPFCWVAWECMLQDAGALIEFTDVAIGICFSWHLGVPDSYSLSNSFLPPNHH